MPGGTFGKFGGLGDFPMYFIKHAFAPKLWIKCRSGFFMGILRMKRVKSEKGFAQGFFFGSNEWFNGFNDF